MTNCDVLMIVKNEEAGIAVTLESLVKHSFMGRVFIYDTGSTDDTLKIAAQIFDPARLYVACGRFDNFAQARNDAQTWVLDLFSDIEWILWLDANDTISAPVPSLASEMCDAYETCQEWSSDSFNKTRFFNLRIVKIRDTKWYGYVHEWLRLADHHRTSKLAPTLFCIEQDRSKNCAASHVRWHTRDIDLLLAQIRDEPSPRAYFYLGRVYKDCGDVLNARAWLNKRLTFPDFREERYWTLFYLAELETTPGAKIVAFERAYEECGRAEALVAAARIAIANKWWHRAFMFCYTACQLAPPLDALLFVYDLDYSYYRWHLLAICAYYVGQFLIGKDACCRAIAHSQQQIDKDNLVWYTTHDIAV